MVRPLNRILNSSSFTKWLRSIKKDNFEVTMYDGYITIGGGKVRLKEVKIGRVKPDGY